MTADDQDLPIALTGKLKGLPLGPKLAACNERERIFVYAYATGLAPSAKQAALMAGFPNPELSATGKPSNSLNAHAHQILHRPRVQAAIAEVCQAEFKNLIPLVIGAAKQVVLDPQHKDHSKVIMGLLSRLGYGEQSSLAVQVTGEVVVDHQTAALEDLRRLKALGVSRDKLIESFGFSGLGRYEKMLAELDGNQPKLIEGTAVEVTGAVSETAAVMRSTPRVDSDGNE
jgi:hypothetical protein